MTTLVNIGKEAINTRGLFSETNDLLFTIRPPQRRFKWKKEQIDQLWQDIVKAHKAGRDSYLLGTLLLLPLDDSQAVSVIDGQQRITALSLLLAVLRDYCREFDGLKKRANRIQQLISREDDDGELGPMVVTLQDPDNAVYEKLVKEPGSTNSLLSQKTYLSSAVKRLREHVGAYINVPNREEHLRSLCEYVQDKIKFLPLQVGSEGEGYLLFDTTNTRGLPPSPSEALKARLATIEREDKRLSEELLTKWTAAAMKLESQGQPIDKMDDYLHAIWCSLEGYTSKQALDRIASELDKPRRLKEFVNDLDSYCDSYLAVVSPKGSSPLAEDLRDLNRLNAMQSHSFLMTVHKNSPKCFEEAVDLVLSFQIRNVSVGPHQANYYAKDWPRWAQSVREGHIDRAFPDIRRRMVSDREFRGRLEKGVVVSSRTVRHLLRRLDPISHHKSGVQPVKVDVEHILPKSVVTQLADGSKLSGPVKRWIRALGYEVPTKSEEMKNLGEVLKPYLNMLGNQALLNDTVNRGAKANLFGKKRDVYKKQALELTKALADCEVWGLRQIEERQRTLAKIAPSIWRKTRPS